MTIELGDKISFHNPFSTHEIVDGIVEGFAAYGQIIVRVEDLSSHHNGTLCNIAEDDIWTPSGINWSEIFS